MPSGVHASFAGQDLDTQTRSCRIGSETALRDFDEDEWAGAQRRLVGALMVVMSSLDLMGKKNVLSFSWEGIQTYPLKSMFSDMMSLLRVR